MTERDDDPERIERVWAIGSAAWPGLVLPANDLGAYLSARAISVDESNPDLARDLYLACACTEKVPGAVRAFNESYFPLVEAIARQFDGSSAFADEIKQRLCEGLFVETSESTARIGTYAGSGPLAGFVGTAVRRHAMRLKENAGRFQGEEELVERFAVDLDPETSILRDHYRTIFNRALAQSLRRLPRRDRIILRLNLVERVSTERIARMHGVSQPTISRWIQHAAATIFASVRELIGAQLAVDTAELDSILQLVRSHIDLTFSHGSEVGGTPPITRES